MIRWWCLHVLYITFNHFLAKLIAKYIKDILCGRSELNTMHLTSHFVLTAVLQGSVGTWDKLCDGESLGMMSLS